MPALYRLSALSVKNAAPGKHEDGGGLRLIKRPDGGGQWVLRIMIHGRRREMGLGSIQDVSLREVRAEADRWRSYARKGGDPIAERDRERREARALGNTFAEIARDAFEARKASLKGDGKAGRWFSPVEVHVLPKIGRTPVSQIDQRLIRDTLAPIWQDKPSAASKAAARIAIILRHAAALGLEVDLQATDKAKALLGAQRHVVQKTPSVPWQDVPAFYASLADGTITHLSLRLLILTAMRSGPLRHLHLDEIDGDAWTIPAAKMKGGVRATDDFRVPLSAEALRVIDAARPFARDGFLFPSARKGVISDATWTRMMDRRGLNARPHGFRSSFRTWAAEATNTPREVAETALAHVIGGKVERSYMRSDFLEQRRVLMQRWADHVSGGTGQLVRLQA